jgi:hypothetical protein
LGLGERRNQADSTKTIILAQNLSLVTVLNRGWRRAKQALNTHWERGVIIMSVILMIATAAAIAITITSITKNSIDIGNFTNVII